MGKNQEYAQQYAEYAMEQMRRYGIPASVTLAQGILESSNGQSRLARNENNHFGIKATPSWIAGGGRYGTYTDDKPNEKFCSYWKSHSTLTLLATQDLPTFLYYMIDPLKSWCWGAILFYPFKNSRFS